MVRGEEHHPLALPDLLIEERHHPCQEPILDGDGVVQFSELSRYVPKRVRELSGGKQSTAVGQPQGIGTFPIGEKK